MPIREKREGREFQADDFGGVGVLIPEGFVRQLEQQEYTPNINAKMIKGGILKLAA